MSRLLFEFVVPLFVPDLLDISRNVTGDILEMFGVTFSGNILLLVWEPSFAWTEQRTFPGLSRVPKSKLRQIGEWVHEL